MHFDLTILSSRSVQLANKPLHGASPSELYGGITSSMDAHTSIDKMHSTILRTAAYFDLPSQHSSVMFAILCHHSQCVCSMREEGEGDTAIATCKMYKLIVPSDFFCM